MIKFENIKQARENIKDVVYQTPIAFAPQLSKLCKANIYLKKENLQITGSFKIRGAFNKIASMEENERAKGVVAASAGNHAQGVAYSCQHFGCTATIVMPEVTPILKINGVKSYGADVLLKGSNYDEAYDYAIKYAKKNKKVFVHPFEDKDVICGQGTIGLEILEQIENIDCVIVPVGGAGLITGVAKAIKTIKPEIKIVGVVASGANSKKVSFDDNKISNSKRVKTIADGIAVRDTSKKMFDYVNRYVDEVVEVEDKEIANAILFLLEKQKLVVEGAGAVTVAAILHDKIEIKGKNVVAILSGGNIDVTMLSVIIEKGLVKSSRKMNLIVTLVDKPGSLLKLTEIFQTTSANIVQIDYDRDSINLDFGDANITISLETKGEEHQNIIREKLTKNGYNFTQL